MTTRNVSNKQYSQLPDAPVFTELDSYLVQSPHHVGCVSTQQQSFVMAGLRNLACSFVAEQSKNANGPLDFSLASLAFVDQMIERLAHEKKMSQQEMETFVSQSGAYIGTCLEYFFQKQTFGDAQWYPSFPSFCFSSFRFPFMKEGVQVVCETNCFAVVTRYLLQQIHETSSEEHPSIVAYSKLLTSQQCR